MFKSIKSSTTLQTGYLDMTYFVENKLVDEDFLEGTEQTELINFLSEPEILVKIMCIWNIVISLGMNSWNVSLGDAELYSTGTVILWPKGENGSEENPTCLKSTLLMESVVEFSVSHPVK